MLCLFPIPPFKAHSLICVKEYRKTVSIDVVEDSKETVSPDTTRQMEIWIHRDCGNTHNICTSSIQSKSQHTEGEALTSNYEAVCTRLFLREEKNSYLQWGDTGNVRHSLVQASCSGAVSQQKTDSMLLMYFIVCLLIWA